MPWPTVDELAAYQRTTISSDADVAAATQALELAKGAVQAETGQTIELVADDEITLDGNRNEILLLPEIPVTAVSTVEQESEALTLDDHYYWTSSGILRRLPVGTTWGSVRAGVAVTYSHGYVEIPAAIRGIVLAIASRLYSTAGSAELQSETIGNYSYQRGSSLTTTTDSGLMTEAERRVLDVYRADTHLPR